MNGQNDDPAEEYQCSTLVDHEGSRVWITLASVRHFKALDEAGREKLRTIMRYWCEERALTDKMFNGNEGRSTGGTMLKAFKTFKHRFYGFERKIGGSRTFVVLDYDGKKQNKADPVVLKRAKARIDEFEGK